MEEIESVHPDYLKGFNEGYLMKKHLPELADKLLQIESDSLRISAIKNGAAEYVREIEKARYPSWLKDDHRSEPDHTPDKSLEKDIDDLEPER